MKQPQKILFTGASGFLGANILNQLKSEYELVSTVGRDGSNDIVADLASQVPEIKEEYDIVLHAAGKAHMVPQTPEEEKAFYDVNLEGTKNLCKALEKVGMPKSFIFISTVAVYGCDSGDLITEEHPLNGTTPYAKSKILAEEFLADWCKKNGVVLTILRPSLLAGVNPPGNLGDMIKGVKRGFYVNIGKGDVRKSILMAEDIANLIPLVKDRGGVYNICDTDQPTFGELSRLIASQLGKRSPISIPYWIAKSLALVGDVVGKRFPINSRRLDKLTQSLTFSNHKAVIELGWQPLKVIETLRVE